VYSVGFIYLRLGLVPASCTIFFIGLRDYPLAITATSCTYAMTYVPIDSSFQSRHIMVMFHTSGDGTPPCGHPLNFLTLIFALSVLIFTVRNRSTDLIRLITLELISSLTRAFLSFINEILSKDPLHGHRDTSFNFSSSATLIRSCSAFSIDLPSV